MASSIPNAKKTTLPVPQSTVSTSRGSPAKVAAKVATTVKAIHPQVSNNFCYDVFGWMGGSPSSSFIEDVMNSMKTSPSNVAAKVPTKVASNPPVKVAGNVSAQTSFKDALKRAENPKGATQPVISSCGLTKDNQPVVSKLPQLTNPPATIMNPLTHDKKLMLREEPVTTTNTPSVVGMTTTSFSSQPSTASLSSATASEKSLAINAPTTMLAASPQNSESIVAPRSQTLIPSSALPTLSTRTQSPVNALLITIDKSNEDSHLIVQAVNATSSSMQPEQNAQGLSNKDSSHDAVSLTSHAGNNIGNESDQTTQSYENSLSSSMVMIPSLVKEEEVVDEIFREAIEINHGDTSISTEPGSEALGGTVEEHEGDWMLVDGQPLNPI